MGRFAKKRLVLHFYPITFYKSDDKCGSAADHAKELNMQVQQILKNMTATGFSPKQINIVGHSKGARTLLTGPPASVKSLFMLQIEKFMSSKVYFTKELLPAKQGYRGL
jgi:hypothetical protein